MSLHLEGMQNATRNLYQKVLPEGDLKKLVTLNTGILQGVENNINEWLMAEGDIQIRGGVRRINDYVISPEGPRLTAAQRDWIQQLGQRPLRLYVVTDVVQGQQLTLCDELDKDAEPIVVRERSGTKNIKPGETLGCRIMRTGDHFQLSGAAYFFQRLTRARVLSRVSKYDQNPGQQLDARREMGLIIMREWLRQWLEPAPMPTLIDRYSGDLIKFVTDHYRVDDELALVQALATQSDVEGSQQVGWTRHIDCADGQRRASAHINPGKKSNQMELLYRTQRYADEGRVWFDTLAGKSVTFVERQTEEAADLMTKAQKQGAVVSEPMLDAVTTAQLMTKAIHAQYSNWADKPIPALGHETPRQAIKTSAGLERVKGLLRTYEAREAEMAAQQRRTQISYDFLWAALGLTR